MSGATLRLGTRASALAMWQARHVAAAISDIPNAPTVEIVEIRTTGDAVTDVPLWATPGKGVFTAELDRALIDRKIDLAVHSLKDLPTEPSAELFVAAVLKREDARDALVVRQDLDPNNLPRGTIVGTSSLRRRAFLARWRPDLKHLDLRGNVPTRVAKLDEGTYGAIVLAAAGLKRLGLADRISMYMPMETFPPAVAQGAIAVVARRGDQSTLKWMKPLDHAATHVAVRAERALLRHLEGGCQVPLGAHAYFDDGTLKLRAAVCSLDGSFIAAAEDQGTVASPEFLGVAVAEELLRRGAKHALASMPAAVAKPAS